MDAISFGLADPPVMTMTQKDYLEQFQKSVLNLIELTRRKNADYADVSDAFKNFRLCESIGVASTADGILVRMTDKLQRVANLVKREGKVKEESVYDTLDDLSVYSQILKIWLRSQHGR